MASQEPNVQMEIQRKPKNNVVKIVIAILVIAALAYFGKSFFSGNSNAQQPAMQAPPAPAVALYDVQQADLATGREYVGKVAPIQTVSIKPQIAGEIAKVYFKEGSIVKAGQLLFTIDPRTFAATVELRKADLAKATANYDRAKKYLARLKAADSRSVSASDLDVAENDVLQGQAAIDQGRAALRLAQIDLGYTRITAPIAGQIGKAAYTKGNYVSPASGPLAEIVQVDPIRVEFALPDKDYLDQLRVFKESGSSVYNTTIRLSNGNTYPFSGVRDFEDNTMDDRTGSIMMYVRFANDKGLLVPGSMVRVMTKPVESHIAAIVPQESVLADTEGDYVYTVDASNVAHVTRVKLGAEVGAMREVISGLEPGAKVIVRGLQSVRPEAPVNPAPLKEAGEAKTPAEEAMESGSDLTPISGDSGGDKNAESEGSN